MSVRRRELEVDDPVVDRVTAAVHRPPRGTARTPARSVLLTPGAGGDLDGAGLVALARVLTELGCTVVRANLPYREAGRRAPRADRSVDSYRAVLAAAQAAVGPRQRPWIVGGKSYGGRVASMAIAAGMPAAGLLLYGYPLHPPGKPEQLRVDHWPDVEVPVLFLQGERDGFGRPDQLEEHLRKLPRRSTVHVVGGGDHSLRVSRAASPTGEAASEAATIAGLHDVLRGWLKSLE